MKPSFNLDAKLEFAAQMRRNPTAAEATLWYRLKKKQTGFVFHRQSVQRGYILDFYCPSLKIAIEVDGSVHQLLAEEDARKEGALADFGIKVLRFTNQDVLDFMPVVMTRIETTLRAFSSLRFVDGDQTSTSSSNNSSCGMVENRRRPHHADWASVKQILNLPENLCRPKQIPEEQRLTRESAEVIVGACKKFVASDHQRSSALNIDTRTMAERAFDQKHRLQEWLKKNRPESVALTDPAVLTLKGMHVAEPIRRKA